MMLELMICLLFGALQVAGVPENDLIVGEARRIFNHLPEMPEEFRGSSFDRDNLMNSRDNLLNMIRNAVDLNPRQQAYFGEIRTKLGQFTRFEYIIDCNPEDLMEKVKATRQFVTTYPNFESAILVFHMKQLDRCIRNSNDRTLTNQKFLDRIRPKTYRPDEIYAVERKQVSTPLKYDSIIRTLDSALARKLSRMRIHNLAEWRETLEDQFWYKLVEPCSLFDSIHRDLRRYFEEFIKGMPLLGPSDSELPGLSRALAWIDKHKVCKEVQKITVYGIHIHNILNRHSLGEEEAFLKVIWETNNPYKENDDAWNAFKNVLNLVKGTTDTCTIDVLNELNDLMQSLRRAKNIHQLIKAAYDKAFVNCVTFGRKNLMSKIDQFRLIFISTELDKLTRYIENQRNDKELRWLLDEDKFEESFFPGLALYWRHQINDSKFAGMLDSDRPSLYGDPEAMARRFNITIKPICDELIGHMGPSIEILVFMRDLVNLDQETFAQEMGFRRMRWVSRVLACHVIRKVHIDFGRLKQVIESTLDDSD